MLQKLLENLKKLSDLWSLVVFLLIPIGLIGSTANAIYTSFPWGFALQGVSADFETTHHDLAYVPLQGKKFVSTANRDVILATNPDVLFSFLIHSGDQHKVDDSRSFDKLSFHFRVKCQDSTDTDSAVYIGWKEIEYLKSDTNSIISKYPGNALKGSSDSNSIIRPDYHLSVKENNLTYLSIRDRQNNYPNSPENLESCELYYFHDASDANGQGVRVPRFTSISQPKLFEFINSLLLTGGLLFVFVLVYLWRQKEARVIESS
ncbi:MAG: hypothetical protein AAF434_08420 [Pseudomonadota bacterium]